MKPGTLVALRPSRAMRVKGGFPAVMPSQSINAHLKGLLEAVILTADLDLSLPTE